MKPEIPPDRQAPLTIRLDPQLTFKDWLLERYTETPRHLHDVALATGSYRDYEKLMQWCRQRYRYEMELQKQFISVNPFDKSKEDF